MNTVELFTDLRSRGVVLKATGDRLRVDAPKGSITPELREAMIDHKLGIIALLMTGDSEVAWRVAAMASQIPEIGCVPLLVAREAVEPKKGECLSCGENLATGGRFICTFCGRAKNVVIEIAMARPVSSSCIA
jgi:hypothetical protein